MTTRNAKASNVKVLEAALGLVQQNLKGSQGSERLRLQAEEHGIREMLRKMGE